MTASKYSIGVHNYAFNNAPINTYATGELAAYLADLGLADAGGAIAHTKLQDTNGLWSTGAIPTLAAHQALFLSEARALGFRTLLAWTTPPAGPGDDAPWTDAGQALLANFDAAAALVAAIPDADILIYGNEREVDGISNSDADGQHRARYFALEDRAGAIWRGLGKLWAVGADEAAANFLGSIEERTASWSANPDWLALHLYGTNTVPAHLQIIREAIEQRTGRAWEIVVSEWALDFENLTGWNTKEYVRDSRARDYAEHFGRELRRQRMHGCYFTFKEVVRPLEGITQADTTRYPLQGLDDALSDVAVNPLPPARSPTGAASRTYRYLREGRLANGAFNAAYRAAKEYARSIVGYPAYWGS